MKNMFRGAVLIFTLLAALFAAVSAPVSAEAPAPDKQTAKFEITFMEGMIDHHMMAIMMAEMCTVKAVHPELVTACEDIIATQSQEMMMMQMWLQNWYGITYEPKTMMGEMKGHMMMDPAQFEEWFMKRMISHHATAIKEAEECLEEAFHPELLSTCQNIVVTQSQEIEMFQTWLCEWFGVCNYRKNL